MDERDCALDGHDLAILAHASGTRLPPGLSKSWRLAALRRAGLLQSTRQGLHWFHQANPMIGSAVSALSSARHDIEQILRSPIHTRTLAAARALQRAGLEPARRDVMWLVGASRSTFSHALQDLRDSNVLLERDAHVHPNPDLPELPAFLDAMQAFVQTPPSTLPVATPIHAAGFEAAWRAPASAETLANEPAPGIATVATDSAFAAIVNPWTIHFRGVRKLDRWDHALLLLRSDARPTAGGLEPSPRLKALVLALMTPRLALDPAFQWRARFYGLQSFAREAATILTTRGQPRRQLDEFHDMGTPEGWLDAR